ncbi:MAG: hypothetical protein CMJ46_05105 [Planctomyces sp.]|nr:hypothetical protein [Planctomyces sp.]
MNSVARAVSVIAFLVIVGALLIFPWFNGGADTRPQVYFLLATIASVGVGLLCSLLSKDYRPNLPTSALILFASLSLAGLQLLPMANSLWDSIGNNTPELRHEMSSAEGLLLAGEQQTSSPLSLYPSGTRLDIALFLVGVIFFMLGAQFLSRFEPFRLFMILLATNGALLACFGFVQRITWNGKLYWTLPVPKGGTPFASFIYHNQAASIFAFSLAASIGYLIDLHRRRGEGGQAYDRSQHTEWNEHRGSRTLDSIQFYIADLNGERLFAISLTVLNVAGLLFSLSRGGLLCFLLAGIIVWAYATYKRGRATWINMIVFGAILIGLLSWISMTDVVSDRLQTLLNSETFEQESRIPHWQDTLGAVQDYGIYGTGLGTYRYIYHDYQQHVNEGWFLHAHNQYLEALVDAGVVGLSLMLLMIAAVAVACWKLFNSNYFYTFVVAVFGSLVLFFMIFHAAVDYVLYLPATMALFAALTGAFVGRAVRAAEGKRSLLIAIPHTGWAWPIVLTILLGGSIWSYSEVASLNRMETIIKSYPKDKPLQEIETSRLRVLITQLENALEARPDDAQGQEALADYYISLYRLEGRDTLAKELKVEKTAPNLWEWTNPIILSDVAWKASLSKDPQKLKDIREQETVVEYLAPALEHLKESLKANPLIASVHYRANLIGFLDEDWTFNDEHLDRAERIGSWNADIMFAAGQMRFSRGNREKAISDWSQSLRVDARNIDEILRIASGFMKTEEILAELVPDDPETLMLIAERMYSSPQHSKSQELVLNKLSALLEQESWPAGTTEFYQARMAVLKGDAKKALELYGQAVAYNPNDLEWNYHYAMLLRKEGKLQEAERILSYCVRLAPGRPRFSNLLNIIREQRKEQDAMKPSEPFRS